MWYRGPDLQLGLVNSAFVEAVEARDAADVIARGAELIDDTRQRDHGRPQRGRKRSSPGADAAGDHSRRAADAADRQRPAADRSGGGFAIDVQDLEDARTELDRHMESQRELADRMTAGTAQFDADRNLSFFNRPFAVMTQLDPDGLASSPSSTA